MTCGYGAEIAARVAGRAMTSLLAPIERVSGYDADDALCPHGGALHGKDRNHPGGGATRDGLYMSSFALPDLRRRLAGSRDRQLARGARRSRRGRSAIAGGRNRKGGGGNSIAEGGTLARLLAKVGERVKVGAILLEFEEGPHAEAGSVVGQLAEPATIAAPPAAGAPAAGAIRATPAVRARARELGVDLARVTPTGPGSTVTMSDVQAAAAGAGAGQAPAYHCEVRAGPWPPTWRGHGVKSCVGHPSG